MSAEFANTARRYLGAAAGLRGDVSLPPELKPDAEPIAAAARSWARHFLGRLDAVRRYLAAIAEGGK